MQDDRTLLGLIERLHRLELEELARAETTTSPGSPRDASSSSTTRPASSLRRAGAFVDALMAGMRRAFRYRRTPA
jgi:hypothetical protein